MEALQIISQWEKEMFSQDAVKIGVDEFSVAKLHYTMCDSDLDVFEMMGSQRLDLLLYFWTLTNQYYEKFQCVEMSLGRVVKVLANYSFDLIYSQEWANCQTLKKQALLYCLTEAKSIFVHIPKLKHCVNWDYMLNNGMIPWEAKYFKRFLTAKRRNLTISLIENEEAPLTPADLKLYEMEGLLIMIFRLIKMFDCGYVQGVRLLAARVISAFNFKYNERCKKENVERVIISEEEASCAVLICNIYLMAIYELDNERGFVIDNTINNIHFYYQCLHKQLIIESYADSNTEYTPACLIAMTCMKLGMRNSNDVFTLFAFRSFKKSYTTLFGVVSQAYVTYVLGNILMEMNNLHNNEFLASLDEFKRVMDLYVIERERNEIGLNAEIRKQEMQHYSHNAVNTVQNKTDFKSKLSKGNRFGNLNQLRNLRQAKEHQNGDDKKRGSDGEETLSEPIFQKLPNDVVVLEFAYDNVLRERDYKGWKFTKIVLLLKIMGYHLNGIAMWRYHPGLTTDFMIDLDIKLSRYYEDLASIFSDCYFMEQEMILTAFYLNPCERLYNTVVRCGIRYNKRRNAIIVNDENLIPGQPKKPTKSSDKYADVKFGLLSCTMDIADVLELGNHANPESDYKPLRKALRSLNLPANIIKDLLTVIFIPRHKSYTWALNWAALRKRCKTLVTDPTKKRHLIELNMSEANERLQFLNIDYEKYKHRPQLDYGTIERGYENAMELDNAEEDDYDDYMDDEEPVVEKKKEKGKGKFENDFDISDIDYGEGRRTRTRTAAAKASARMLQTLNDDQKSMVMETQPTENNTYVDKPNINELKNGISDEKVNFMDWVKQRHTFRTSTNGYLPFPNVWKFDKQELQTITNVPCSILEKQCLAAKLNCWKRLENGESCSDSEDISFFENDIADSSEILIINVSQLDDFTYETSDTTLLNNVKSLEDPKSLDIYNNDDITDFEPPSASSPFPIAHQEEKVDKGIEHVDPSVEEIKNSSENNENTPDSTQNIIVAPAKILNVNESINIRSIDKEDNKNEENIETINDLSEDSKESLMPFGVSTRNNSSVPYEERKGAVQRSPENSTSIENEPNTECMANLVSALVPTKNNGNGEKFEDIETECDKFFSYFDIDDDVENADPNGIITSQNAQEMICVIDKRTTSDFEREFISYNANVITLENEMGIILDVEKEVIFENESGILSGQEKGLMTDFKKDCIPENEKGMTSNNEKDLISGNKKLTTSDNEKELMSDFEKDATPENETTQISDNEKDVTLISYFEKDATPENEKEIDEVYESITHAIQDSTEEETTDVSMIVEEVVETTSAEETIVGEKTICKITDEHNISDKDIMIEMEVYEIENAYENSEDNPCYEEEISECVFDAAKMDDIMRVDLIAGIETVNMPDNEIITENGESFTIGTISKPRNIDVVSNAILKIISGVDCNAEEEIEFVVPYSPPISEDTYSEEGVDNAKLKKECLQRQAKVILQRLNASDLKQLRQPKVCIQRLSINDQATGAKRRRTATRKVYYDSDDSAFYSKRAKPRRARKPRKRKNSPDGESDLVRKKPRQERSQGGSGRNKNLVATPRSPSGLKLRISSLNMNTSPIACACRSHHQVIETPTIVDYINITESTDEEAPIVDPLYEEEIMVIE